MSSESWEQIRAGVGLLKASRLVRWDCGRFALLPVEHADAEGAAYEIDPIFGRVTCWLIFSAGAEYLLKGVCLQRGLITAGEKRVIRPPSPSDDLGNWADAALAGRDEVKETVRYFGTLANLPLEQMLRGTPEERPAIAGLELLRQTVRNRDAHAYIAQVRDGQFHLIGRLFVPALNAAVGSLDKEELRANLPQ